MTNETGENREEETASNRRPLIILALIATAMLGYLFLDWQTALPPEAVKQATFVGRQSCVKCHQEEARAYHGSHHDRAMELANEETILGDFDDAEFTWLGVTTKMFRRDGKYFMNAEGPDGEMHDYEIEWTFGIDPLQQYMTEFPDGRVQVLPASWDVHRKEWFAVTPPDVPDTRIEHDDPLHWTGIAQNWNTMCADCHSTNLQKNYDLATDTYSTDYSEIDVSCEACHGPGSVHVELAESSSVFWDRRHGYGLSNELKKVSNTKQVETCAPCHSRRAAIHPNYHAGKDWFDHYQPSMLDEGLYHANGHIQDEVYVYGSFIQSKMYHKDVRCTDCHNPHSLELKYEGNQLCNQCHQPGKYDVLSHHHHPEGPATEGGGTQCISCHMSVRTYMNIDDRHDHSFRVPRPDLTVELGTPNACNDCHTKPDEDAAWAADWVKKWFGDERPPQMAGNELASRAIYAGRKLKPEGEELLLEVADDKQTSDITRATALQLLSGYPTEKSREVRKQALYDRSELIRIAASRATDKTDPQTLLNSLRSQLEDP
ncbi:MAG: multiheme c-type cytochrome, partial [Lacipirellulaceae bacterium]